MKKWAMICWSCYRKWVAFRRLSQPPPGHCPYCGSEQVHAAQRR